MRGRIMIGYAVLGSLIIGVLATRALVMAVGASGVRLLIALFLAGMLLMAFACLALNALSKWLQRGVDSYIRGHNQYIGDVVLDDTQEMETTDNA